VIEGAVAHSAAHEASLRFTSPTDRGGYAIAALSGDLGIASAPALREQLRSLLRAASQLIIDLSAVEHADASGLAVLVGSGHRARLLGGSLRLAAPSPEVARVLSATGMNQHLDVFPTVRAAITGQPGQPGAIFPSAAAPARGHRIDAAIAGVAAGSIASETRSLAHPAATNVTGCRLKITLPTPRQNLQGLRPHDRTGAERPPDGRSGLGA